jgi:hypothetical protein
MPASPKALQATQASLPRATGLVLPFPKVRARRPAVTAGEFASEPVPINMGAIVRLLTVLDEIDRTISLAIRRAYCIPACLDRR